MYIRVELYIQTHKLLMPINYPHLDIYNATRFKHYENDTHDIFQGYKQQKLLITFKTFYSRYIGTLIVVFPRKRHFILPCIVGKGRHNIKWKGRGHINHRSNTNRQGHTQKEKRQTDKQIKQKKNLNPLTSKDLVKPFQPNRSDFR